MTLPTFETIASYITILIAIFGALTAAFWLSLVIWSFRDMRLRSRDPFAWIMAALLVATLPFVGVFIYMILRPPETLAERYERALEEEALLQEIEERPHCPKCSRHIEDEWVVCPTCHLELKKQCVNCVNLLELDWQLCAFCSASQPTKRPPLNKERLRERMRPAIVAADVDKTLLNGHADSSRLVQRRYRAARVGGEGDQTPVRVRPVVNRVFVGNSQPTVVGLTPGSTMPETQPVIDDLDTQPHVEPGEPPTILSEPKPQRVAREKRDMQAE